MTDVFHDDMLVETGAGNETHRYLRDGSADGFPDEEALLGSHAIIELYLLARHRVPIAWRANRLELWPRRWWDLVAIAQAATDRCDEALLEIVGDQDQTSP